MILRPPQSTRTDPHLSSTALSRSRPRYRSGRPRFVRCVLETDKPGNVRLYRRGGFEVVAEQPILGVTNWFMQRQPARTAPGSGPGRYHAPVSTLQATQGDAPCVSGLPIPTRLPTTSVTPLASYCHCPANFMPSTHR